MQVYKYYTGVSGVRTSNLPVAFAQALRHSAANNVAEVDVLIFNTRSAFGEQWHQSRPIIVR